MSERHKTWDVVRDLANLSALPWMIIGDFNEVLLHSEHDGVGQHSQAQIDGS